MSETKNLADFLAEELLGWKYDPGDEGKSYDGSIRVEPCWRDSAGLRTYYDLSWRPEINGSQMLLVWQAIAARTATEYICFMDYLAEFATQAEGRSMIGTESVLCVLALKGNLSRAVCLAAARALGWES